MPSSTNQVCSDKNKVKEKDEPAKTCTSNKWRKERCSSAGTCIPNASDEVGRDVPGGRRSLPPKAPSATGRLQRERRTTKPGQQENIPKLSLPLEDEAKNEEAKEWCVPHLPVESASDSQLRKSQPSAGLQRTTLTYSETIRSNQAPHKMDVKRSAGESPTKKDKLESRPSKSSLNAAVMAEEAASMEDNAVVRLPNSVTKDSSLSNDESLEMKSTQDSSIEELDVNLNAEEYALPHHWEVETEPPHGLEASDASNGEDVLSSADENDGWTKGEASDASACSSSQEESEAEDLECAALETDTHLDKLSHPHPRHPANSPLRHPFLHDFNTSRSEPTFPQKSFVPAEQSPLILPQRSASAPAIPACQHAGLGQKWSVCANNGELFLSCNVVQVMTVFAFIFFAYLIYLHCK